jgi:hypothetical protein
MPSTPFEVGDAVELAELLEFLSGMLGFDRAVLTASLARFVGVPDCPATRCAWTSPGSGSCWASQTERACSPRTSVGHACDIRRLLLCPSLSKRTGSLTKPRPCWIWTGHGSVRMPSISSRPATPWHRAAKVAVHGTR